MGYNNANNDMKKENKELQSRREFFKKAAKSALPILGAVILASSPIISKATQSEVMGCTGTCYGTCKNACTGCEYTCEGTCKNACTSCKYTCEGTCDGSCKGTCYRSSR